MRRHKALERQCDKAQRLAHKSLGLGSSHLQTAPPNTADGQAVSSERLQQEPASTSNALGRSKGVSRSLPDVSVAGTSTSCHQPPEATFTPTAAGLHPPEAPGSGPQLDFHSMISSALSTLLAAGLQQAVQGPFQALTGHQPLQEQAPPMTHASRQLQDSPKGSDHGEEGPEAVEFSED